MHITPDNLTTEILAYHYQAGGMCQCISSE